MHHPSEYTNPRRLCVCKTAGGSGVWDSMGVAAAVAIAAVTTAGGVALLPLPVQMDDAGDGSRRDQQQGKHRPCMIYQER